MRAQLWICLIVGMLSLYGCSEARKTATSGKSRSETTAGAERSYMTDAAAPERARFASANTTASPAAADHSPMPTARMPRVDDVKSASDPPTGHKKHEEVRLQSAQTRAENPTPYRAGTLTAGSFDDNARYRDYREYLSTAMQRDPSESLPRLALGERIVVRVVNEKNEPVNDALVVLQATDKQHDVATQRTASDGRAVFLSSLDDFSSGSELVARVALTASNVNAVLQTTLQQPIATIERTANETTLVVAAAPRNLPQQLDLSLVIDTTGSMSDELEYLKTEIDAIAAMVRKRFPNVDQRYSLIVYRDEGDEYVSRKFDFTGSLADFQASLSAQRASGGGDYPEAMHVALSQADSLNWRTDNTARVMFLVADAPPHRRFASQAIEAIQKLRAKGVTVFPVAASGVQDEAEFVLRGTAFLTRGRYLFLTDHSGVGNPHARPNVPDFEVERLDQLMIRMIAWKLSGEETGMQEIIATSQGDEAAGQSAGIAPEQNNRNQPTTSSAAIPSAARPARSSSGLFSSIIAELWQSDYWLRPNRYWLLGAIIVGIIVLDRREVQRRRRAAATLPYVCQHRG
jgi:hypothetical protein